MKKKMLIALMVLCSGQIWAMGLAEWVQAIQDRGAAIRNGNWSRAVDLGRQILVYDRDGAMPVPINAVTDYMYLFFCSWNMGDRAFARECLREGISYMSSRFGNDCDSRAKVLLAKVEAGEMSGRFSYNDIMGSAGICNFILELPKAVSERHHALLMNQIQASIDIYQKEGEWQATHAKFHAKREYEDKYHRSFDPNDRPPEGSQQRDDWDSCKRIYDIFSSDSVSSAPTESASSSFTTTSHVIRQGEPAMQSVGRNVTVGGEGATYGRTTARETQKISVGTLSKANKMFEGLDGLFESIMSKPANEILLAPGEDLSTVIGRSSGRTTIRLQAGRYILGGENGVIEICNKIRLLGAGRGQTIIVGNFSVKPGTSLVLKDLTLTGPTANERKLKVGSNSVAIIDNVELKCAVDVGVDGSAIGRKVRQFLRNSYNFSSVDSHCVFIDSIFIVSGFYAFHAGSSHVGFKNCNFVGTKDRKGSQSVCFLGYGVDGHVPFYVSQSFIMDFDVVFKSFTSEGVSRRNGIYMNDVQLKGCKSIVEGGTCKAYRLRMLDMEANESFIEHVETPLDIPVSWK